MSTQNIVYVPVRNSDGQFRSLSFWAMSPREKVDFIIEWIGCAVIIAVVITFMVQTTVIPKVADALYDGTQTASAYANAPIPTKFPVLDRIGDCESGDGSKGSRRQFLPNGNVVTHTNANGSVDVGMYQINMTAAHINLMAKKGFNPLTLDGNKAMAEYIYLNEGTGPWSTSQKCWR